MSDRYITLDGDDDEEDPPRREKTKLKEPEKPVEPPKPDHWLVRLAKKVTS